MARTVFAITADNQAEVYPDDSSWPSSTGQGDQNINRYASVGLIGDIQYPLGNDFFSTPLIKFRFLDAYGNKMPAASTPKVALRAPKSLNLTNISDYVKGEAIFGAGSNVGEDIYRNISSGAANDLLADFTGDAADFSLGAAQALQYALEVGLGNVLGFVGSAGLGNISQYEFSRRRAINPMAQMLYKGPGFRRYQLPFEMKPRNEKEAKHIIRAVSAFRLASSPSVPNESDALLGEGATFTFGYPHLVQFDLVLFQKTAIRSSNIEHINLYRSKPCVIESVSVDYGGAKFSIHEDGYPVETTMSLSLIEITPRTLGDAQIDAKARNSSGRTLQ